MEKFNDEKKPWLIKTFGDKKMILDLNGVPFKKNRL